MCKKRQSSILVRICLENFSPWRDTGSQYTVNRVWPSIQNLFRDVFLFFFQYWSASYFVKLSIYFINIFLKKDTELLQVQCCSGAFFRPEITDV